MSADEVAVLMDETCDAGAGEIVPGTPHEGLEEIRLSSGDQRVGRRGAEESNHSGVRREFIEVFQPLHVDIQLRCLTAAPDVDWWGVLEFEPRVAFGEHAALVPLRAYPW